MATKTKAKGRAKPYFEIYKAADGWRWRLVAANKRITCDSGEAFTRKASALRSCMWLMRTAELAPVIVRDA